MKFQIYIFQGQQILGTGNMLQLLHQVLVIQSEAKVSLRNLPSESQVKENTDKCKKMSNLR